MANTQADAFRSAGAQPLRGAYVVDTDDHIKYSGRKSGISTIEFVDTRAVRKLVPRKALGTAILVNDQHSPSGSHRGAWLLGVQEAYRPDGRPPDYSPSEKTVTSPGRYSQVSQFWKRCRVPSWQMTPTPDRNGVRDREDTIVSQRQVSKYSTHCPV